MSMLTTGASEVLHRFVYPPFSSLWSALCSLTGRQRRAAKHANSVEKSAEKQRRKTLWNRSHDR